MMAASGKKTILGLLLFALFLAACGDDGSSSPKYRDFGSEKRGPGSAAAEAKKRAAEAKKAQAENDRDKKGGGIELPELTEVSFIADPRRRDPFSPFWELLLKNDKPVMEVERNVKLKDYDITELKLIGIITNIGDDRAMVTTPDKTGYVLKRGDYVGRTDFVKQGNDGAVIQVNWKVARIHGSGKEEERGIYLTRDDPTTARGVDVTRFIPLHPPE